MGSADIFDLPIDDPRHRQLRDDAWIGGPMFECCYYLGWYRKTNEYRCSQEEFERHLSKFLVERLSKAARLHKWLGDRISIIWLKAKYRMSNEGERYPIKKETKEERAIVLMLDNPMRKDVEIRRFVGTSEKTMRRWGWYRLMRRELECRL